MGAIDPKEVEIKVNKNVKLSEEQEGIKILVLGLDIKRDGQIKREQKQKARTEERIITPITKGFNREVINKFRAMSLTKNPGNGGNPINDIIGVKIIILLK